MINVRNILPSRGFQGGVGNPNQTFVFACNAYIGLMRLMRAMCDVKLEGGKGAVYGPDLFSRGFSWSESKYDVNFS